MEKKLEKAVEEADIIIHVNNVKDLPVLFKGMVLRIMIAKIPVDGFYSFKMRGTKVLVTLNN